MGIIFVCGNFEAGAALEVVDHSFGTFSTTMSIHAEMPSLRASTFEMEHDSHPKLKEKNASSRRPPAVPLSYSFQGLKT